MRPISERADAFASRSTASRAGVAGRTSDRRSTTARELDEARRIYLAPAEPTKVIAVHLTYRSRIEEYAPGRRPSRRTS